MLLDELEEEPERTPVLASTYLSFLNYAFARKTGRFHNHMSFDRRWLDEVGSEDAHGRALWALGLAVGRSTHRSFQVLAGQLFARALSAVPKFNGLRALAFTLVGIHEYRRRLSGDRVATQLRDTLTARLMLHFDKIAQPNWPWFEGILTYDNAKLPHALILSGQATGQKPVLEHGLLALRWLAELQTSEHGHFRPIGCNGFYRRGGTRADFDQQPLEAQGMVSACIAAYHATSDPWWQDQAQRAFDWFLGWNDLGLDLTSSAGGCRDALHVDRANENQGAESTLSYLLALAELQLLRETVTILHQPAI